MKRFFKNGTTLDMTVGTPWRLILTFTLPIFLSQLFQQLYNTVDTLIVGQFLGTEALAAVSSSGTLIFLFTSFFDGTAMGAGIVISRYFGAKDTDNVSRAIHTNLAFGLASGLFLTVAGVVLTPTLLRWMQTDPDILPDAVEYFRYYFFGSLAVVLYNVCRSIMNAIGDSTRPLIYLIVSSLLNILLDYLFIGVFGWGVWAAAVATVLSQSVSVILCLAHLLKKGHIYSVSLRRIRFHADMLAEILKNGLPAGVQNSVIGLANVVIQSQINGFGKFATAAYGAQSKIEGFAFLPITSFSMAISTFVSQNLGAGNHDRAKRGAGFGVALAVFMAEGIGIAYYFTAPYLFRFFDSSPQVIDIGVQYAHITSLFYCLLAFSHAIAAVCRGAGKAFVPMLIMLSVWCVFRLIYILIVVALFHDIRYIIWAYPITRSISSVIYFLYYTRSDWVHGFDSVRR